MVSVAERLQLCAGPNCNDMSLKKNVVHPNFIIGLVSYFLLLTGIIMNANRVEAGYTLIIVSVLLGGFHWIRSIIDVWNDRDLKSEEAKQYFWLGLVIMIPPLAGMMYYMINQKKVSW